MFKEIFILKKWAKQDIVLARKKGKIMKSLVGALILGLSLGFFPFSAYTAEPEPSEFKQSTSENLTAWAWKNYKDGNYSRAIEWARICTFFWGPDARAQSEGLVSYSSGAIDSVYKKYWALNDAGTCWVIMAESWRKQGQAGEAGSGTKAEVAYRMLTDENHNPGTFYFAQCASDSAEGEQYFWKPADVAYARLIGYTDEKLNNVGLLKAAWEELNGDREKARKFAKLCIDMYTKDLPAKWAINDLGTGWFIIGEAWRIDGDQAKANEAYQKVIDDYPNSECFDPASNAYWNVAEGAKEKME